MIIDKTGITVTKVRSALEASSTSVSALCTHDNINPWAKYKPVNINNPSPDRNTDWWKGDNGKCGLMYKMLSNLDQVKAEYDNNSSWKYEKVAANYPKRLADFGGYYKEATPPITGVVPPVNPNNKIGGIITFTLQIKAETHPNELSFADLRDIGDGYLGIAVYGSDGFYKAATAKGRMSQMDGSIVEFKSEGFLAKDYLAVPFFALNKIIEDQTLPSNKYFTLPGCSIIPFTVKDAASVLSPEIYLTARLVERNVDGWPQLDVDVTIKILKLGSTEVHIFEPVVLRLTGADGRYGGGYTWNSWDVNMNNSASQTKQYTIANVNPYFKTNNSTVTVTLSKNSDWSQTTNVIRQGGFQPVG